MTQLVDDIGALAAEGRPQPVDVPQEDGVVRLAPEDVQNRGKNILSFGLNFNDTFFVGSLIQLAITVILNYGAAQGELPIYEFDVYLMVNCRWGYRQIVQ